MCKGVSTWVNRMNVYRKFLHPRIRLCRPSFNSAESLYEDLRMVIRHSDHVDRLAVVGDRLWKRTWVGLFGLFSKIEADYFEMEQIDAACQWITQ